MLHAQYQHEPDYQSYLDLARRVQALMSTPRARIEHQIVISREPWDTQIAWDQLLDEIREAPGVRLTQRADGSVHVGWFIERH
ncbi:DUF1654 domain-containing protein [Pseudomonas tohonis]|uniref:DUF1654 domain-containing protein n=1 Tax=Pseudomonas tohonis TaxID=2725477 RepID=UPI0021D93628|nr:DUF1654 domain-containing protein [Pseudomonas tohonis]UXY55366.1 DUF1654 domain-containing protein [Pseudomonas tohonis]